ncbi:hypothetical protein BC833DRAFT_97877 [Globomyces pollinis-pini]|nr:hypothetical protein BC833DRAFT_97877 [Globomyces pollinis-pini]
MKLLSSALAAILILGINAENSCKEANCKDVYKRSTEKVANHILYARQDSTDTSGGTTGTDTSGGTSGTDTSGTTSTDTSSTDSSGGTTGTDTSGGTSSSDTSSTDTSSTDTSTTDTSTLIRLPPILLALTPLPILPAVIPLLILLYRLDHRHFFH